MKNERKRTLAATMLCALAVACAIALAGCKVVSEPEPIAVQSVTINTTTLTLAPGDTDRLSATVLPLNADNRTVTWSSSDRSVASVIYDGTITAEGEGKAIITAQAGNQLATCEVTVKHKVVAVSYFTINERSITLDPGARRILTATIYPDNATDKSVTWSSSNPEVATVENNGISDGMITAISPGTATITAQSVGNGDMVQCMVIVSETEQPDSPIAVESITLNTDTLILEPNTTSQLTADVMPSDADDKTVVWRTSDYWVATVDYYDGTVTAHNEGTATITAQAGDKTAECEITVKRIANPVTGVTLDQETLTLRSGDEYKLTATVTPSSADYQSVTWSSYDPEVATVDHNGTVTAHKSGWTEITATTEEGGFTAKCDVSVTPIESITLDTTKLFLTPAAIVKLTASFKPNDTVYSRIDEWSTSNEDVVELNLYTTMEIMISAKKVGTAIITAKAFGVTATCEVIVHNHSYSEGKCTVCGSNLKWSYGTIDENGVLTEYTMNGQPTVIIPKGVTGIGKGAFSGKTLGSVQIPDSVTFIGDSAFYGSTLESVTIPDSVKSIGAKAFYSCQRLKSVDIPAGVTSIGIGTFYYCVNLTSVDIPASVTSIGSYAFSECTSLTNVDIPANVTSIGSYAFSKCTSLTNVDIPANVTSIGSYAFSECTNLTSIKIPNNVTSIESGTFSGCKSLVNVTIPTSMIKIGEEAFNKCTGLTSIVIPKSVTSIGDNTFYGCTGLKSVTIPDSVTNLGIYAFYECTSLASMVIPKSVTSIGDNTFYRCTSLKSVTIPDSVTNLGDYAFYGCTSLEDVTIPGSVKNFGSRVFSICTSLTSVVISNGVKSIGEYAFSECTHLASVDIPASVTSIGHFAFYRCSSLTSVTIPENVTSIESGAFRICSFTSVTIPNSVKNIGKSAFIEGNLKTVTYDGTGDEWISIQKEDSCFPKGLYIICKDVECPWDIN